MTDTETKIKTATKDLLLKEGNFGLSMYDIADRSEVSRTVIHYYFRSKENLLNVIGHDIIEHIVIPKYKILFTDEILDCKIEKYISQSEFTSKNYPYLDVYIMSQYQSNTIFQQYFESVKDLYNQFLSQIQVAIKEKKIDYATPECFLIDLFTLTNCSFMYSDFLKLKSNPLNNCVNPNIFTERKKNLLDYFFRK